MIPFLVNGVVLGAIYGVVALGIVLVYKGSRVINFAHGEMGMIGAFVMFALWTEHHWPYLLAAALGILIAGAIGLATERLVVSRFVEASILNVLVATLAVAVLIQFVGSEIWGQDPKHIEAPVTGRGIVVGQVVLSAPRLVVIFGALFASVGLYILFRRTTFGLAFRGTALDSYAARLVGVNVRYVSAATWTLGAMLSGFAAILVAPLVNFHVGFMSLLFLRALAAAMLAGLTNLAGAFAAGIMVGVAESVIVKFTNQPGAVEAVLFAVIVLTLAVRPRGIFAAEY